MANQTVGLQDLVERVADETGLNKSQARKAVDAILHTIEQSLSKGEEVRLTGFGTFKVRETAERMGRNPRTGEPTKIAAGRRPAFSAGSRFTEAVRGGGTRQG